MDELRKESGNVSTMDPLSVFLYILISENIPLKKVEESFEKTKNIMPGPIIFNNGWLGKYVTYLIDRLQNLKNKEEVVLSLEPEMKNDLNYIITNLEKRMGSDEAKRIKEELEEFNRDLELNRIFDDVEVENVDKK